MIESGGISPPYTMEQLFEAEFIWTPDKKTRSSKGFFYTNVKGKTLEECKEKATKAYHSYISGLAWKRQTELVEIRPKRHGNEAPKTIIAPDDTGNSVKPRRRKTTQAGTKRNGSGNKSAGRKAAGTKNRAGNQTKRTTNPGAGAKDKPKQRATKAQRS